MAVGSPDLVGIQHNSGRFVAIEAKTQTGKIRPEQQNFIDFINKSGGIAGICRSVEDFKKLLLTGDK